MNRSAAYTGLALVTNTGGTYLLAPNFGRGVVEALDRGSLVRGGSTQSRRQAHHTLRSPRRWEILCRAPSSA